MTQQTERKSEFKQIIRPEKRYCGPQCVAIGIGVCAITLSLFIGIIIAETNHHLFWLALGYLGVCGILIPLSLGGLYYAFHISEQKRKQAEAEHIQLEKYLRHAQKMEAIGSLASGIAHDFNNILYAIQGYVDLAMQDVNKESDVYGFLEEIAIGNQRATELVKQILAFGMQVEQERQPIQLSIMVKEVVKFLKSTLPTSMELHLDIQDHDDYVLADPSQLHQIILNLCTNAYQAMPTGNGQLSICLDNLLLKKSTNRLKPGFYLRLSITDTGVGISPEDAERIFEPYFTTKKSGTGTGLGLATVHSLVSNLGGAITFESKKGHGTTFTVHLPICQSPALPEQTRSAEQTESLKGHEHILLVDDEEPIIFSIKLALQRLGYRITATTHPDEALSIFESNSQHFDLIITDYTMPHMTGIDLAHKIRTIRADIPILLCTGFSEIIKREEAAQAGIKECIIKPIKVRDLAQAIRREVEGILCAA